MDCLMFPWLSVSLDFWSLSLLKIAALKVYLQATLKTVYIPTLCWIKHLCSIKALVPISFSLSLSLFFSGWSPGVQRLSEFTFLPGLLRPSREGALRLHPIERVPEASLNRASPVPGALLAFCVNQGISASFCLLYFLINQPQTTRFWSIKGP